MELLIIDHNSFNLLNAGDYVAISLTGIILFNPHNIYKGKAHNMTIL